MWQKQINIFWLTDVESHGEIATFQLTIVEVIQSMTQSDSEHGLPSQADVVPSLAWCDLRHPWWQWQDLLRRVVMKTALTRVVSGNQENLGRVYLGIIVFTEVRSGFWEPQGRVQNPGAISQPRGEEARRGHGDQRLETEQPRPRGSPDRSRDLGLRDEAVLWWLSWEGAGEIKIPIYTSSSCLFLASTPCWPNPTGNHWTYRSDQPPEAEIKIKKEGEWI